MHRCSRHRVRLPDPGTPPRSVKAMEVDEKPTEDYSDIGGLDKQVGGLNANWEGSRLRQLCTAADANARCLQPRRNAVTRTQQTVSPMCNLVVSFLSSTPATTATLCCLRSRSCGRRLCCPSPTATGL